MGKIKEIWKKLSGYDDKYEISCYGRIRNNRGLILKTLINKDGYEQVPLREGGQKKIRLIHRLVGITYIENPDLLPLINHKDENKLNNYYKNLEWCTISYNNNYGNRNAKISKVMKDREHWHINLKPPIKIKQICRETGEVLNTFYSLREASLATGITRNTISRTARKIFKKSRCKFDWKYED